MIHLYLARHGETEENVKKILQGHLPGQLTAQGKVQATHLCENLVLNHIKPDHIIVSDLQRTLDTAYIVNERLQLPLTSTSLLRERDWGSLTGLSYAKKDLDTSTSDIESIEDLFNRAHLFIDYLFEHFDGKSVLAIGHGLFNRCIIAAISNKIIQDIPRMQNAEYRALCLYPKIHSSHSVHEVEATND